MAQAPPSSPRLRRPRTAWHSRRSGLRVGLLLLAAVWLPAQATEAGHADAGVLVREHGVTVLLVHGPPEAMGAQEAGRCRATITGLLRRMVPQADPDALRGIPAAYRGEVQALARGAGVDPARMATADLVVDTCCTAIAGRDPEDHHIIIARNLDFSPQALLGAASMVRIARGIGVHAVASVGWPGYSGVLSGINDAGVVVCLLLNRTSTTHRNGGDAIGFRLRAMLEHAGSFDQAVVQFGATPVASPHYVLVADAQHAALVWQDADGVHEERMEGPWISVTNGGRGHDGHAVDTRGRWLARQCARVDAVASDAWLRRVLTGCYLTTGNPQAMIFRPGDGRLEVSFARPGFPAALAPWGAIDLRPLLDGCAWPSHVVVPVGSVEDPLPHA